MKHTLTDRDVQRALAQGATPRAIELCDAEDTLPGLARRTKVSPSVLRALKERWGIDHKRAMRTKT